MVSHWPFRDPCGHPVHGTCCVTLRGWDVACECFTIGHSVIPAGIRYTARVV
jgi:hypothetical protein